MPQERLFNGPACRFCDIIRQGCEAHIVYEDELSLAFLDYRPLFHGHTLLVPKQHYQTLPDLPSELLAPLFSNAQLLARAVEKAMDAQGTFVAMNNRVSQSVPHLHVHIVPRRRKDGLRGFFWPRQNYEDHGAMETVAEAIRSVIAEIQAAQG